ncbi:hypothetical protein [Propionivibrio sp.]|uniref:hypothetical protein n=1 Tax=Propionivibrio sp. TaxID=2212460 RepID=UPI00262F8A32|nr:hypothetical protein [Propionivibrio sp.]
MPITATLPPDPRQRGALADSHADTVISVTSAVSWGAIAAGAAAGAALSLILLILGVGLGLSSVSPWSSEGISAANFGVSTIVWLTLTQLLSSAMGGYLAGRLRSKWMDTHTDEVYFRDTAHGFLAWAVASLATATLLTSAIGGILNGGIQAGASVVSGVANTATVAASGFTASGKMAAEDSGPMAYFVDSLFRRSGSAEAASPTGSSVPAQASERTMTKDAAEVGRIFMNVSRSEPLPPTDIQYVGQLVAQRTGMSQQEAEKRVTDVYARAQAKLHNAEVAAKDALDKARKASAYAALWVFVSLLIGAFVASLAATYGGRQRDA